CAATAPTARTPPRAARHSRGREARPGGREPRPGGSAHSGGSRGVVGRIVRAARGCGRPWAARGGRPEPAGPGGARTAASRGAWWARRGGTARRRGWRRVIQFREVSFVV